MEARTLLGTAALLVTGLCQAQPGPFLEADLLFAAHVCSDTSYATGGLQSGIGSVADLDPTNRGCLLNNERQGVWMHFQLATAGKVGFTIAPPMATDYDFGVWGPFTAPPTVLTSQPLRCGWSALAGAVGLNYTATDLSENASGDGWLRYIDALEGEWYVLYVDNFSFNGVGFDLSWQLQDGATLACLGAPEPEFTGTSALITAGGTVSFTDASTNHPYAWYWEFPGGQPASSLERHPQDILYGLPGCYDVSLTAYNAAGSELGTTTCAVNVETGTGLLAEREAPFSVALVGDVLRIRTSTPAAYQVRLVDALGKVVLEARGSGLMEIGADDIPAGSYTVLLQQGAYQLVHRVAVVH